MGRAVGSARPKRDPRGRNGLSHAQQWTWPGGYNNRRQEPPRCYQQSTEHRRPGSAQGAGSRARPPRPGTHWGWVAPWQPWQGGHWETPVPVHPPQQALGGSQRWCPPPAQQGQAGGRLQACLPTPPTGPAMGIGEGECGRRGVPAHLLATGLLATLSPRWLPGSGRRGDKWPSIPNEMGETRGPPGTQSPTSHTPHRPGGAEPPPPHGASPASPRLGVHNGQGPPQHGQGSPGRELLEGPESPGPGDTMGMHWGCAARSHTSAGGSGPRGDKDMRCFPCRDGPTVGQDWGGPSCFGLRVPLKPVCSWWEPDLPVLLYSMQAGPPSPLFWWAMPKSSPLFVCSPRGPAPAPLQQHPRSTGLVGEGVAVGMWGWDWG